MSCCISGTCIQQCHRLNHKQQHAIQCGLVTAASCEQPSLCARGLLTNPRTGNNNKQGGLEAKAGWNGQEK